MSTRGFIGFVVDDTEKIAYNHSDSYPGGLGVDVLGFLRSEHLGRIERKARDLRVVDATSKPTAEDIERLRPYTDSRVGSQDLNDWYVLLRGTQGNPAAMLDAGVIEDASGLPTQSLFAEYGYIVDLDAKVFEAYKGFQKAPHTRGRFASRELYEPDAGYYACALVASWPLDALPTDDEFCTAIDGPADGDDAVSTLDGGQ